MIEQEKLGWMIRNCQYCSIFTHRHRIVLLWKAVTTEQINSQWSVLGRWWIMMIVITITMMIMMWWEGRGHALLWPSFLIQSSHSQRTYKNLTQLCLKNTIKLRGLVTTWAQGSSQWNTEPVIGKRTNDYKARHTVALNSVTVNWTCTASLYCWSRNKKTSEMQLPSLKSLQFAVTQQRCACKDI